MLSLENVVDRVAFFLYEVEPSCLTCLSHVLLLFCCHFILADQSHPSVQSSLRIDLILLYIYTGIERSERDKFLILLNLLLNPFSPFSFFDSTLSLGVSSLFLFASILCWSIERFLWLILILTLVRHPHFVSLSTSICTFPWFYWNWDWGEILNTVGILLNVKSIPSIMLDTWMHWKTFTLTSIVSLSLLLSCLRNFSFVHHSLLFTSCFASLLFKLMLSLASVQIYFL